MQLLIGFGIHKSVRLGVALKRSPLNCPGAKHAGFISNSVLIVANSELDVQSCLRTVPQPTRPLAPSQGTRNGTQRSHVLNVEGARLHSLRPQRQLTNTPRLRCPPPPTPDLSYAAIGMLLPSRIQDILDLTPVLRSFGPLLSLLVSDDAGSFRVVCL